MNLGEYATLLAIHGWRNHRHYDLSQTVTCTASRGTDRIYTRWSPGTRQLIDCRTNGRMLADTQADNEWFEHFVTRMPTADNLHQEEVDDVFYEDTDSGKRCEHSVQRGDVFELDCNEPAAWAHEVRGGAEPWRLCGKHAYETGRRMRGEKR